MTRVAVLGGGVAGMTVAHELAERGFAVTLFERRKQRIGGKARTEWDRTGPIAPGNDPLPGEHGFRFFPGFYRHVPDTMRRIPFPGNAHGVFDNLVDCQLGLMAPMGQPSFRTLVKFPTSIADLRVLFAAPEDLARLGITADDMEFFLGKIWQILTSCQERRLEEYGRVSWWEFVDAASRSKAYQTFLAIGLTRNAVATRAEKASARTIGDIGIQLALNMSVPGECADRVLNGPTSTAWLEPWLAYLEKLGVDVQFETVVTAIQSDGKSVTGVTVSRGGEEQVVTADAYVSALPVEIIAPLLPEAMRAADPVLAGLTKLAADVEWMTGIQFYLAEDVPIVPGHVNCLESPWALTAISQRQFWPSFDFARHGDGKVQGVLSVDISDWTAAGLADGPAGGANAMNCTREVIAAEVWEQLRRCLNTSGALLPDKPYAWFLDKDIQPASVSPHKEVNLEPLLVNVVDSWELRPEAYTRIPNFFLAGDFVRTNTDFASMEGACEAGRRAVNAFLQGTSYTGAICQIWDLHEPVLLAPERLRDKQRYDKGLPWAPLSDLPREWLQDVEGWFRRG